MKENDKIILAAVSRTLQVLSEGGTPIPVSLPNQDSPLYHLCQQTNALIDRCTSADNSREPAAGNRSGIPEPGSLLPVIIDHSPYGIISMDDSGVIAFGNRLAGFLLDISRETRLNGINLLHYLEKRGVDTAPLRHLLAAPPRQNSQRTIITFQDDIDVVSLSLSVISYPVQPEGKFHFLIFLEDLTGKTTLADAIQFYTENLETMVAEKTREIRAMQAKMIASERVAAMVTTAGGIAHELRQPLTTIIGNLELLLFNNGSPGQETLPGKKLETILQQAQRMADIIKKMEKLVEYQTKDYVSGARILDLDESSQEQQKK